MLVLVGVCELIEIAVLARPLLCLLAASEMGDENMLSLLAFSDETPSWCFFFSAHSIPERVAGHLALKSNVAQRPFCMLMVRELLELTDTATTDCISNK